MFGRISIEELTLVSLSKAAFAELIPPPYLHIKERISPNDGDEVTIQAI